LNQKGTLAWIPDRELGWALAKLISKKDLTYIFEREDNFVMIFSFLLLLEKYHLILNKIK